MRVSATANVWLRPAPDASPERQLLVGDPFEIDELRDGWAFGRALKDGYQGCILEAATASEIAPTHWVSVRTTWGYAAPDIKSEPLIDLHMSARLEVVGTRDKWLEARQGAKRFFVFGAHVKRWEDRAINPVGVARQFLGAPYVWAGNSGFGLDCSGLVQIAYHACGWACAPDSQDQASMPGNTPENVVSGDLIFWKDHVAIETGEGTLIHANAHHMAVAEEPRHLAMSRIAATETGPVTARLRPERRALT